MQKLSKTWRRCPVCKRRHKKRGDSRCCSVQCRREFRAFIEELWANIKTTRDLPTCSLENKDLTPEEVARFKDLDPQWEIQAMTWPS